ALGRLRIVEPDALDEELADGAARIGDHHVEEGPFLGAAARKTNHHHEELTEAEKGVILRELSTDWQGKRGFRRAMEKSKQKPRRSSSSASCCRSEPSPRSCGRRR